MGFRVSGVSVRCCRSKDIVLFLRKIRPRLDMQSQVVARIKSDQAQTLKKTQIS